MTQTNDNQCKAITPLGRPCLNAKKVGDYCGIHAKQKRLFTKDKPFCLEDEEQTGGMYDYECKMFFKAHIKQALAELLEGVKQDFKDIKFEGFEVVINKRAEKHFGKSLIPNEVKA